MISNQNQPGIGSAKSSGGGGSASLDVGVTPVVNGTAGRIFYEKLDNTLGQVPGFSYDETTTTLVYQDMARNLVFLIGEVEIAPSISIPLISFSEASSGANFSITDVTSLGGDLSVFFGFNGGESFRFINNNSALLNSDSFSLQSRDFSNTLLKTTNNGIAFYGVTPVARQIISATPTNAEIATVLNNIGIAEIV